MPYPKTEPKANFPKLEHEVLEYWNKEGIFKKSLENTKDGKPFLFYDGPPFGNGMPHWGHLGVSAVKDMVSRYQTMKGRFVDREFGWDCHGFPAENSVEKKWGKQAKDIVAEQGLAAFCDMCRTDVSLYTKEWATFIERMGRWVDMGDNVGYRTMDKDFMESVIWTISELYKKGLLYKDYKVNPYDWKMGSVLSNSEASADYRDVVDDAVTVWFELENGRRVLAWTTTPWTLPANSALAVNPNMKYAVMKDGDGTEYIIAESRLSAYEKQFANAEKVGEVFGKDLVGLKYKPLFDYYENKDPLLYQVILAEYVGDDSGTGIVHIAPAFGEEDFWAAKNVNPDFPVILNVDNYGNFTSEIADFAGHNIFDANPKIIEYLKTAGFLVKKEQYKHSYPYGERSKEKLIYRATDAWYIDVPKIKEKLLENNKKVLWTSAGARFQSWIENARPWGISRNRFWGVPMPIWEKNGECKIFGSVAELEEFFGVKLNDLHRPALDALSKDGWKRIPDVLDCWVESGSMPWARLHYPFENKEKFESVFPADYVIEGQDQTRGWFYSLMVLATALFDKPAFKVVSANGMVVDENKKKFSKSLKNFVNPEQQIEHFGADAIRLFILGSNFMKAEPLPIDKEGKVFAEPIKNILTPLWNAYHFFTLYANAGKIKAKKVNDWFNCSNVMDSYILMELNELFDVANKSMSEYQPDILARSITQFLDILNNWYIRLNRGRFWDENQLAFDTLWTVLVYLCRVIAPLAPFIADYIFQNLTGKESVHLEKYPYYTENEKSVSLLENMRRVQSVVSTGKQLREKFGLRNRLPLCSLDLAGWSESQFDEIIKNELNVKEIRHAADVDEVAESFVYLITPKIGARLGGALREIIPAVKNGKWKIENSELIVAGGYRLTQDEFEMRLNVKDGVNGLAIPDNTAVVVLDTRITPELITEGLANDALRFIQDCRKEAGLDVSDRISLVVGGADEILDAVRAFETRIKNDALAVKIAYANTPQEYKTDIEGFEFSINVSCNS